MSEFVSLRDANRALKQLPDFAKVAAQEVMDVTAFRVWGNAQSRVPRRTGFLASRLRWESRPRSVSAVVGVEPDAYYWKYLEYGTKTIAARPFMRPSAMSEEANHQDRLEQALEKAANQMENSA